MKGRGPSLTMGVHFAEPDGAGSLDFECRSSDNRNDYTGTWAFPHLEVEQ